jgi:hypothetical protein
MKKEDAEALAQVEYRVPVDVPTVLYLRGRLDKLAELESLHDGLAKAQKLEAQGFEADLRGTPVEKPLSLADKMETVVSVLRQVIARDPNLAHKIGQLNIQLAWEYAKEVQVRLAYVDGEPRTFVQAPPPPDNYAMGAAFPPPSERLPILPGYEPLAAELDAALAQGQSGKGKNRHGQVAHNWVSQPMHVISRGLGSVQFLAGQVVKKALELPHMTPEAMHAEALGVINYAAGIAHQARQKMQGSGDQKKVDERPAPKFANGYRVWWPDLTKPVEATVVGRLWNILAREWEYQVVRDGDKKEEAFFGESLLKPSQACRSSPKFLLGQHVRITASTLSGEVYPVESYTDEAGEYVYRLKGCPTKFHEECLTNA